MDHRPFELFILKDEPLLPDEQEEMNQHLAVCANCRELFHGWKAVEWNLEHPVSIPPAEGFSIRWKNRLDLERKHGHIRQSITFISLSLMIFLLLSLGVLFVSLPLIQSPGLLYWTFIERLLSLALAIDILKDVSLYFYISIGQQLVGNVSWISFLPVIVIFTVGIVFELVVLWYVSLRVFTRMRSVNL